MDIWRHRSTREKILGSVTLSLILIVAVYHFILHDILSHWSQLEEDIGVRERLLHKNLTLVQNADRINSDYNQLSILVDGNRNEPVTAAQVLKKIQLLARNQIELEYIKPLETRMTDLSRIYEFEVEGRASKEKLTRFLHKIATSDEALKIRSLTLSSTRSGKELKYYLVISKLQLL